MTDGFWVVVEAQLEQLKTARSADDVLRILARQADPYYTVLGQAEGHGPDAGGDPPGFFAGGGGDGSVMDSLFAAGWNFVWHEADYHWAMRAPDGSTITYVEGDIYRGSRK